MENAQRSIMIAVGIFIVILIISIVMLIVNLGINTTNKSSEKIVGISKSLEKNLITMYDDKMVSGEGVLDAIEKYNAQIDYNIMLGVGNFYGVYAMFKVGERGSIHLTKINSVKNPNYIQKVGLDLRTATNNADLLNWKKYGFNNVVDPYFEWSYNKDNLSQVGLGAVAEANFKAQVDTRKTYHSIVVQQDGVLGIVFIPTS